ncbi:MAG TPA: 4-alpha-glucanotransferase [Candidatus Acidoferrales bacterium]|nr:4-alpha-glucanotransferase [Candidatus Acidoferrales bacterium]
MNDNSLTALRRLARLYSVRTQYYDIFGRLREPSPDSLLKILQSLGAPVAKLGDAASALRERRRALWRRCLDKVIVAWDGRLPPLRLRLPAKLDLEAANYEIELESGERRGGSAPIDRDSAIREVAGERYARAALTLREQLPLGYHRLRVAVERSDLEAFIVAAPARAYEERASGRSWGVFAPLYALHRGDSWGAGNYSDMGRLLDWVEGLGGRAVGTLPLLPTFLDEPADPSPYAPVSRLYWNEFYIDPTRVQEFDKCPLARALANSPAYQAALGAFRSSPLVDYEQEMAAKRQLIEAMLHCLFTDFGARRAAFERFVKDNPALADYARFRAMTETQRQPWRAWGERQRDGTLGPGDYREDAYKYHLYAQWLAHEQMQELGEKARGGGSGLYLDFPLGVHGNGYDAWRHRSAFALNVNGGAPPDAFFTKGQDWGFPPFHPDGLRDQSYRYYIDSLRHHMKYAVLLRIDHVMGLHRLFWVPHGFGPAQGTYVHYRADELYAILNLESHRHKTAVVGENLGTVPPSVNEALNRRGFRGMYVGQFCVNPDPARALEEPSAAMVASLNTHDTPTFAAFWRGLDIRDREELGLLTAAESLTEQETRGRMRDALVSFLKQNRWLSEDTQDAAAVLRAWLAHLAAGPAEFVLVTLEDLWLEERPQNTPGTWKERPNWRRKLSRPFERFSADPEVLETLRLIDRLRRE